MKHAEQESPKKVYLKSFGCQMNDRDAENMVGLLQQYDFVQTPSPEDADLILLNTCSIREHASQKAVSQIGRYGKLKRLSQRRQVIGVAGCLVQQEKEKI